MPNSIASLNLVDDQNVNIAQQFKRENVTGERLVLMDEEGLRHMLDSAAHASMVAAHAAVQRLGLCLMACWHVWKVGLQTRWLNLTEPSPISLPQ